jgi:hypothetical protein
MGAVAANKAGRPGTSDWGPVRVRDRARVAPPGARDATVHVGVEEVHLLLARRVVTKHDVTVGVDQAGDAGGAAAVDDDVGAALVDGADGGDAPVLHEHIGGARRIAENAGDERADVDEGEVAQRKYPVGLRMRSGYVPGADVSTHRPPARLRAVEALACFCPLARRTAM